MEGEITFRTSVGGYKKDEVLEYVENMNDTIFQMKKKHEEEVKNYQIRVQELEGLLRQEESNSAYLGEKQKTAIENLEGEMASLHRAFLDMENKYQQTYQDYVNSEEEKKMLKDKLAREILRLRKENQELRNQLSQAEANIGSKADYEAVRNVVSEVQYKIAEYVNVINKTQQSLAETYQSMNGIKKKIAAEIAKAEK